MIMMYFKRIGKSVNSQLSAVLIILGYILGIIAGIYSSVALFAIGFLILTVAWLCYFHSDS